MSIKMTIFSKNYPKKVTEVGNFHSAGKEHVKTHIMMAFMISNPKQH
jgi:hypothetical protein